MEKINLGLPDYLFRVWPERVGHPMREIEGVIPVYSPEEGLWPIVEEDYTISTRRDPDGSIIIKADKDGLLSLAWHLFTLAQEEVPQGVHIHYSTWNMLEEGSCELIIEKS